MAGQNGIDMKLRAAFILPAVALLLVLAILAASFPYLLRPLTFAMPVVVFVALGALLVTERKILPGPTPNSSTTNMHRYQ